MCKGNNLQPQSVVVASKMGILQKGYLKSKTLASSGTKQQFEFRDTYEDHRRFPLLCFHMQQTHKGKKPLGEMQLSLLHGAAEVAFLKEERCRRSQEWKRSSLSWARGQRADLLGAPWCGAGLPWSLTARLNLKTCQLTHQLGISTVSGSSQRGIPQVYPPGWIWLWISLWEIAQYAFLSPNVPPNRDSHTG